MRLTKGMTDKEVAAMDNSINAQERTYLLRTAGETYIVNEDLKHDWSKSEVLDIVRKYNKGTHIRDIAEQYEVDPDEVFLVLFDRARRAKSGKPVINIKQLVMG